MGDHMISSTALKRFCKPVVLRRAQRIVASQDLMSKRSCRFDEGETVLKARVDSFSSWDEAHRTSAVLNEEAEALVDYECDCHSATAGDGPCDHVMALILDYCSHPERFEGYDAKGSVRTSRGIARLIERGAVAQSAVLLATPTDIRPATISLEPTLSYEVGFDVRFRVIGPSGAYTVKSLTDFAAAMESSEVVAYGKRLAFEHAPRMFEPQSRLLAEFIVRGVQNRRAYAFERVGTRGVVSSSSPVSSRDLHLSAPELMELLDVCAESGVLFDDLSASGANTVVRKMRVVHGNPSIRLNIVALANEGFEVERVSNVRMVAVGGYAIAWDKNSIYRCTSEFSKNVALLAPFASNSSDSMVFSAKDAANFCALVLPQLEEAVHVGVTPALDAYRPQPCELQFYLDYHKHEGVVTCDARAVYGSVTLPLFCSKGLAKDDQAKGSMPFARAPIARAGESPHGLIRNAKVEAAGREVVRRFFEVHDGRAMAKLRGERLGTLAYEGVAALQEVGTVFVAPAFDRLRTPARPHIRVGLSVQSNLLDLSLKLEGLPQEELAGLLESYARKRTYHELKDGSFVRMDDASLATAGKVVEELGIEAHTTREVMSMPSYKALMLDGLVDDGDLDDSLQAYLDGIRFGQSGSHEVPESLRDVLRPYQREGFEWLSWLCDLGLGGILADEMGLGKSVQLISFLLSRIGEVRGGGAHGGGVRDGGAHGGKLRGAGPALVVCPSSLVYNWLAEFRKFAPSLCVRAVAGSPQERSEARRQRGADVLVTSYNLLRRDIEEYERMRFWCVTLDEAQYIKNPTTQVAQAVKVLNASCKLVLTGTPVENRLSELWSIFDFLMPGLLGSYERFRERYERPILEGDERVSVRLRDAVRPFILRRTKENVASDLPDKIEEVVRAHMGGEQRKLYDAQVLEVRNQVSQAEGSSLGSQRFQILALLMRLRQICCDPRLLYEGYEEMSCKTETILTLVDRAVDAGEKMLIFSQFTSYLDVLASELEGRGVRFYTITGATPSARRVELVNKFNADDTPVFLISLKAGGTGLNLTGATVVVHADPWWNVAAQNQATDRAHRIGQTREVTVYQVIASGTIEERILDLQRTKAELADAVVQGDVSSRSISSLTREDLEELLR